MLICIFGNPDPNFSLFLRSSSRSERIVIFILCWEQALSASVYVLTDPLEIWLGSNTSSPVLLMCRVSLIVAKIRCWTPSHSCSLNRWERLQYLNISLLARQITKHAINHLFTGTLFDVKYEVFFVFHLESFHHWQSQSSSYWKYH